MADSIADQRKILLVQARNLGDAVISTALVETLAHGLPASRIDVVTRPETARIFADNPHVAEVFTGRFPMGSVGDFRWKDSLALLGLLKRLRGRKYTDVVNMQGDFREEGFGSLLTRMNNWSPAWSTDHPCSKVIRQSIIGIANRPVPIPRDLPNVHDVAARIGTAMTGGEACKPALYTPAKQKLVWDPTGRAVGIHPMASQPWRRWDFEKWAVVAEALIERGMDVHVFGSPAEASELGRHFGHLDAAKLTITTGSLSGYFEAVSRMRVLLCPDSFASHVAYALGVPTILLNGANDAEAWAPPDTVVLAAGPGLSCYPCYNRPTCIGGVAEFACVRGISESSVLDSVWSVLKAIATR